MFARTKTSLQKLRNSVSPAGLARFTRKEDGTITIFAVMMFVLMVGIGGIAIDVMRYETQRVQLQYTLDRAILAAASMTQDDDAEAIVTSYFETSGLERYRLHVDPDVGFNYRRVSAHAEMDINTIFMHLFGVHALTSPAFGVAEERVPNVEISLVLDISGSMRGNDKLENMQDAAEEFVTTVMGGNDYEADEMYVSMSIIPYNGRVNLGETLGEEYNLSNEHNRSYCVRFEDDDFETTEIDRDQELMRISHFDYANRGRNRSFRTPHCQTDDYGAILPWSQDIDELHDHIESLYADGWTAIDLGMKWAVGLLDPSAEEVLEDLIDDDVVHEDFITRPAAYDDEESFKIIVLMTDGDNTRQYDIREPWKSGPSTIFYHTDHRRWSMYIPDRDIYWLPDPYRDRNRDGIDDRGQNAPSSHDNDRGRFSSEPYRGHESSAVGWPGLWADHTARNLAYEYYYWPSRYLGDWDFYDMIRYDAVEQYNGYTGADDNLRAICDQAEDAGITVFSIAFEAPRRGVEVMRYCASTDNHFYNVDGVEISEAFASIANTIDRLRLVQ